MADNKIKLGATFFPTRDQAGNDIPFESLFIPFIYKEIFLEGVYIDVLNGKKDLTIVDIGANIGITVNHFRTYAKKLYAVEPSPEHFTALAKNKEFNNWDNVELFNYALADKDGEMSFNQNSFNRTMNSLIVGDEIDNHTHHIKPEMQFAGEIAAKGYEAPLTVQTKSIDHFFEENNIEHVDFMKFDPEGAEDMILRSDGFKKIADKVDTIMVEFHFPNWMELVDYMTTLGYKARQYESSAKIVLFFK